MKQAEWDLLFESGRLNTPNICWKVGILMDFISESCITLLSQMVTMLNLHRINVNTFYII